MEKNYIECLRDHLRKTISHDKSLHHWGCYIIMTGTVTMAKLKETTLTTKGHGEDNGEQEKENKREM